MEQLSEFVINHWLLVTAFCAVSGLLIANLLSAGNGISTQEAVMLMNRNSAVVVDIRSAEDFAKGHIIAALNIPQAELKQAAEKLRKHQGKPVLVCCASGSTSANAARQLRAAGVDDARPIRGGLAAWRNENLPVASA